MSKESIPPISSIPEDLRTMDFSGKTVEEFDVIEKRIGALFTPDMSTEDSAELNDILEEIELLKNELKEKAQKDEPKTTDVSEVSAKTAKTSGS
ncbi:MAG: hypothetical protein JWL80_61, partial [Parcubacteria group bacterium]|nr:hypothetical protein [Parcubacteria group bacterium]